MFPRVPSCASVVCCGTSTAKLDSEPDQDSGFSIISPEWVYSTLAPYPEYIGRDSRLVRTAWSPQRPSSSIPISINLISATDYVSYTSNEYPVQPYRLLLCILT